MATANSAPQTLLSHDEIKKHGSVEDCWVILHSKVYDVTDFVKEHPGGAGGMYIQSGQFEVCTDSWKLL